MANYLAHGVLLVRTCSAFPEQYDAIRDGERIGYLRLRHGCFTVSCPDWGGEEVYYAEPRGQGEFYPDERSGYLLAAIDAILVHRMKDVTPR